MKKRILSLLCSLAMLVAMLPVSAFAADASWADSAVSALNGIYGSGVFSADDGEMTHGDAKTIAEKAGWSTYKIGSDTSLKLTRSAACEVLADVFDLPIGSKTAIEYLYEQNIVNGKGLNDLAEDDPVTAAEFSVLTYRVLNAVGGGKGSDTSLKPGTDEYFAWMYLAARKCVTLEVYANAADTVIKDVTMKTVNADGSDAGEKTGEDLWNAWVARLNSLTIKSPSLNYNGDAKLLDAVKTIVAAYAPETIFSDVLAGSGYFDGVMYLFDHGIITGNGDGTFAPEQPLPRQQLAVLLYRYGASNPVSGEGELSAAMTYALDNHYLNPSDGSDTEWWKATVTREETIAAIVKACADETDVSKANTAVLGRFSDNDKVSEDAKQSIAYAVSIGILRGNQDGTLGLSTGASRGQAGVLLYRTLIGLDKTKMKDYEDNVSASLQNSAAAALFSLPVQRAETTVVKTLTLREDWRLTSDLDLEVPAGTALRINGDGHHIYEMGDRLLNSGAGTVTFVDGTILYPAGGATEGVTVNVIWDTEESNALMAARQSGNSGGGTSSGGGGSSSSGNKTETTTNPDGSTTTTVTRPDGSTTETTKNPDGSTEVVDIKKDGTVTTTTTDKDGNKTAVTENTDGTTQTTITNTNGTSSTTTKDADGKTETTVKLPASIVADAADKGETVALPMPEVNAASDSADAPSVTVDLSGSQSAKVEIPVAGVTPGTVVVLVDENGDEQIVMNSIPTENGVAVTLADGETVKIVDNSKDFADVADSYWGADAVAFATGRELFNGTSSTTFEPDGAMNRAMIVTVLARYEGVDTTTGDTWYDAGRDWAMQAGISDGTNMEQDLTREQLATMLYRYAQGKGQGFAGAWAFQLDYPDADAVSDYAHEAMCWATMHGIINGRGDGTLASQEDTTRAEVATMLMRFIENIA